MNPEFINGPTNYAKLKGIINGVEKEIHIFFDKHLDLNDQTECKSFNSIDITYYLYNLIKESNEPLDFFMEISIKQLKDNDISNKREIYIKEVIKLFKSEFIEKNNEENLKYSKTNPNVKLHYFDIRDHLDIFFLTKIINYKIIKYLDLLKTTNENENEKNKYDDKILFYLNSINEKIDNINENTKEVKNNKLNKYDKIVSKQKYYLDKILNKYENENVGININLFLYIHCNEIINNMKSVINNMKYMIENKFLMNFNKFDEKLDKLGEYVLQLYSLYTDAYLMRRILDKNYIKKCLVYTGNAHSVNIIFFLVKFLGFNIIKIQKSVNTNTNTLIDKIKNEMFSFDIYELFLLKKVNIQCIQWEPLGLNDSISAEFIKNKKKYMKKLNLLNLSN